MDKNYVSLFFINIGNITPSSLTIRYLVRFRIMMMMMITIIIIMMMMNKKFLKLIYQNALHQQRKTVTQETYISISSRH